MVKKGLSPKVVDINTNPPPEAFSTGFSKGLYPILSYRKQMYLKEAFIGVGISLLFAAFVWNSLPARILLFLIIFALLSFFIFPKIKNKAVKLYHSLK